MYSRELVEEMLPLLFEEEQIRSLGDARPTSPNAKGIKKKSAVDPVHRQGTTDPKKSNSHWLPIMDLRRAYDFAGLERDEKASILCRYALDLNSADGSRCVGIRKARYLDALEDGLQKILYFLNGDL